jgi:hypothetical protein
MKNNSLTPICLVAAIGLGIWGGWEHQQRAKLEDQLKTVTAERELLQLTANKKIALSAKTEVKPDGPEGLGKEHAEDLQAEKDAAAKKNEPAPNPMREGLAKMMENPAAREAMRAQMRGQVDYLYRDLLDMLNLPEDKREAVSKLLTDRTAAAAELGMRMMGGKKLTPEEQKAQSESMSKSIADSDTALKEALGEQDYAKFDRFEKSQPERMQLNSITSQMKDAGVELSPEAESQLMDAMYEERTAFKFDNDMGNTRNFDMSRLTAENLQRYQEQHVILQEKIYDRAASILSPEQLPVFKKSQESQAALQKMQLEMAAKMFQPPAPAGK